MQVGFGKAGFYSNNLLDNVAHPSADRTLDEFQEPNVGDWVPMFSKVNDTTALRIASIKPAKELVWVKPDSTWAWTLTDVGGPTRLVTRLRILYPWHRPADALLSLVLFEFGDFPMMRKMLRTLKQRAEDEAAATTGKTYETDFVHVVTFQQGQIARFQEFFDTFAAGEAFRPG